MTETSNFEGRLDNPDISEKDNSDWEKAVDSRHVPAAARAGIPAFTELAAQPKPVEQKQRHQTAAEQRLPYAQAIQQNLEDTQKGRLESEAAANAGPSKERLLELLGPTSADIHHGTQDSKVLHRGAVKAPSHTQEDNQ